MLPDKTDFNIDGLKPETNPTFFALKFAGTLPSLPLTFQKIISGNLYPASEYILCIIFNAESDGLFVEVCEHATMTKDDLIMLTVLYKNAVKNKKSENLFPKIVNDN